MNTHTHTCNDMTSFTQVCIETYTGLHSYSPDRNECKLVHECTLHANSYHTQIMILQFDHCNDELVMWKDRETYTSCADVKPGSPPYSVVELFLDITHKCTQRNHKRCCDMQEVNLLN